MNVQGVSTAVSSRVESDPQVKRLEAQIKDWECCPTTDPKTKKTIVDKLETQLDSLKSSLDKADSSRLDIRA